MVVGLLDNRIISVKTVPMLDSSDLNLDLMKRVQIDMKRNVNTLTLFGLDDLL